MELNFLIDTNIAIQFEETGRDGQIRGPFQKLHSLLVEHRLPFFYHPVSVDDLDNDADEARRRGMLSRLKKYPALKAPPIAEGAELERLFGGIGKSNDHIDCQLLYAVKRNCVTYLISEDTDLQRRARNSGLEDRVLNVAQTIDVILRRYEPRSLTLPNIKHEFVYNLDVNDSFFDSLKADYNGPEFVGWLEKCAQQQRRCWSIRVDDKLAGICIYKVDDKQEYEGIDMPSIKLCTFKISEEHEGRKFGEHLLKMALQHAVANKVASIWVTANAEKQVKLIHFLKRFGFQVHSSMSKKDMVFFKLMAPPKGVPAMEPFEFFRLYSPHYYDGPDVPKFVIPIKPEFHDILFPELAPQPQLEGLDTGKGIPGNTIRKVYLSHANIKELRPGSLIYFYISSPTQSLMTAGIVERSRRLSDMASLAPAIGKRSVYSQKQVSEMIEKEVLVIDFWLLYRDPKAISLATLKKAGVFVGHPPQTISQLPEDRFAKLKKLLPY